MSYNKKSNQISTKFMWSHLKKWTQLLNPHLVDNRLDELGDNAENYIAQKEKQALNTARKTVDEAIDYAVESARTIAISWVRTTLREYLSPFPRVN